MQSIYGHPVAGPSCIGLVELFDGLEVGQAGLTYAGLGCIGLVELFDGLEVGVMPGRVRADMYLRHAMYMTCI